MWDGSMQKTSSEMLSEGYLHVEFYLKNENQSKLNAKQTNKQNTEKHLKPLKTNKNSST